jgi:hypothetical protein
MRFHTGVCGFIPVSETLYPGMKMLCLTFTYELGMKFRTRVWHYNPGANVLVIHQPQAFLTNWPDEGSDGLSRVRRGLHFEDGLGSKLKVVVIVATTQRIRRVDRKRDPGFRFFHHEIHNWNTFPNWQQANSGEQSSFDCRTQLRRNGEKTLVAKRKSVSRKKEINKRFCRVRKQPHFGESLRKLSLGLRPISNLLTRVGSLVTGPNPTPEL